MPEANERILVVDDSVDLREAYQLILEGAGYAVVAAATGDEAWEQVRAERPALIVLDVVMPGMDGLELLMKLRSDLAPPVPPVILCSGFDITRDEALRRGALAFLRKPFAPDALLRHVADALHGRATDPGARARADDQATAARQRRLTAASEVVARLERDAGAPGRTLVEISVRQLEWLAGYFGIGGAVLALTRGDRLIVVGAAGAKTLPEGLDLGQRIPQTLEILETGSSLVLADVPGSTSFRGLAGALDGACFVAGVPLVSSEGVPVGVVGIFDSQPRRDFGGEDLALLELFGRRGSLLLQLLGANAPSERLPGHLGPGLLERQAFDLLVDLELRLLERHGGSIELMIVDLADSSTVGEALRGAAARDRLAAGALAPHRLALFKRDRGDAAAAQLARVLDDLRRRTAVCAVGAAAVAGRGLPALVGADLERLASLTLERAIEAGAGMHRLIIRQEGIRPH